MNINNLTHDEVKMKCYITVDGVPLCAQGNIALKKLQCGHNSYSQANKVFSAIMCSFNYPPKIKIMEGACPEHLKEQWHIANSDFSAAFIEAARLLTFTTLDFYQRKPKIYS